MIRLLDRRIDESSALAHSVKWPNVLYTCNDEPTPIFAVDTNTGRTVGTFRVGQTDDTESLAVDPEGTLYVGDIGDNDAKRSDCAVYKLPEPGPGDHSAIVGHRLSVRYPDGPRNAEALLVHPDTLALYIVSKERHGHLYRRRPSESGWTLLATYLPAYVTDGVFVHSGRFVLLRRKGVRDIQVLTWPTWKVVDTIRAPWVDKGESICMSYDGTGCIIGSEGVNSPLIRVPVPSEYR